MTKRTETPPAQQLLSVDWSKLPRPEDDRGADHLGGKALPSIPLSATTGAPVDLSTLSGLTIVFAYPRTGRPDEALPDGWDLIPGARGCTPQACAFRDSCDDLKTAGARAVFGLSTQTTSYQQEAARRLHLPYPLLSDAKLELTKALKLPTMEVEDMVLLKRLTLIIRDGIVETVFYPVFPPDQSADAVLRWLAR